MMNSEEYCDIGCKKRHMLFSLNMWFYTKEFNTFMHI